MFLVGLGLFAASEREDDPEARVAVYIVGAGITLAALTLMLLSPLSNFSPDTDFLIALAFLVGISLAYLGLTEEERRSRCYCDP